MESKIENIKANLISIKERIKQSADACGRNPDDIKLITVTKAQSVDVVETAILAGSNRLGENYPLEAVEKITTLKKYSDVEWHMIGHLQSRKSSLVAEYFDYLHSLDSLKLARKLNDKLQISNRTMPVLLEVNVSGEESKFGWSAWDETQLVNLFDDIEELLQLRNLKINGLMTMPPFSQDNEKVRPYFKKTAELLKRLATQYPEADWKELSMGTSVDFETAIQEGATFVRVGTAIVGPRQYQN